MKKRILFTLIGAIVIFVWQFLSYAILNLHKSGSEYTPAQGEILQKIEELGLDEGMYQLGQPDMNQDMEEYNKEWEKYHNKPWAVINYQKERDPDMIMPLVRGFVIDLIIACLLFWIFTQLKDPSLKNKIILALSVGMISFFFVPYTNFIWFKNPDIFAYLIDGIAPWAILGLIGHKMA